MKGQSKTSDNIKVYHFATKTFDEIIDRERDDENNVIYITLKNAGKITSNQLEREYGLAHEAEG